jgi:XRE family transcriptional regulator, regulator of sulfur utilization
MTLGERIKYLRINRNWSLRELSEATGGTSKGYLSEIERGNMRPTVTTLDKLAKAFDISPAVLLGGQDSELTPTEQALLDAYRAGDKLGAIRLIMNSGL